MAWICLEKVNYELNHATRFFTVMTGFTRLPRMLTEKNSYSFKRWWQKTINSGLSGFSLSLLDFRQTVVQPFESWTNLLKYWQTWCYSLLLIVRCIFKRTLRFGQLLVNIGNLQDSGVTSGHVDVATGENVVQGLYSQSRLSPGSGWRSGSRSSWYSQRMLSWFFGLTFGSNVGVAYFEKRPKIKVAVYFHVKYKFK